MKTKKYDIFGFEYLGKKLKIKAKTYRGFWKKFTGKMFSLNKQPIVFEFKKEQKVKIHMFFVFMPLLVVWFDAKKKVIKIKIMKPFISFEEARAKYVLEIPLGNKLVRDFEHIGS